MEVLMISEIAPSVYRIESVFGGRPLYQYLLLGDRPVLVDTGASMTPRDVILPAMRRLGLAPNHLSLIVVTHCDYDHQGGNHAMKAACPGVLLTCGRLDQPLVADPGTLFTHRYDAYRAEHGIAYDDATKASIFENAGPPQPLDATWAGGETFTLSAGWEIELLHVPGHSHGHLTILDRRNQAVYTGDAVHWSYYPGAEDGQPKLPPTYLYVDTYLSTIRELELLDTTILAGGHWPLQRGADVADFLVESRRFVEQTERAILTELGSASEPRTLREIIERVGPQLGDWPAAVNIELVYAFAGHLDRLIGFGRATKVQTTHPTRYTLRQE
jgi:glyoxylase-like metal-dependent hydrolase (beta-lactamase superfamily II)